LRVRLTKRALSLKQRASAVPYSLSHRASETGDECASDRASLRVATGNAHGGNDRLENDGGGSLLVGDAESLTDNARGGDDLFFGGGGEVFGDAGYGGMSGNARGGNDRLEGSSGNDGLAGDGDMSNNARGGNDWLNGGAGDDQLTGDGHMSGNTRGGNDRLFGGDGDDVLYGDGSVMGKNTRGGDDQLHGGSGHDIFGFGGGDPSDSGDGRFGHDVVLDFHPGEDRLEFDRFDTVQSIADLQIVQHGHDTVITVPDHGTVELLGVTAPLTASDFIFVA
jgi:serralysin